VRERWPQVVDVLGELAQHVRDLHRIVSSFQQRRELALPGGDAGKIEAKVEEVHGGS
jgi:hypothetical protein